MPAATYRTPAPQAAAETADSEPRSNDRFLLGGYFVFTTLGLAAIVVVGVRDCKGGVACERKHCDVGQPWWNNGECVCVVHAK